MTSEVGEVPVLYGDGTHDDTLALEALLNGRPVRQQNGRVVQDLPPGVYLATRTIELD